MTPIQRACIATTLILAYSPVSADEPTRLDRNKLLQFRGDDGTVQPVATAADWQKRRVEILRGMQEVMGKFPRADRRISLDVQVEEEADAGKYVRRLITYQSEPLIHLRIE